MAIAVPPLPIDLEKAAQAWDSSELSRFSNPVRFRFVATRNGKLATVREKHRSGRRCAETLRSLSSAKPCSVSNFYQIADFHGLNGVLSYFGSEGGLGILFAITKALRVTIHRCDPRKNGVRCTAQS
jgi:hypothetical protein